MENVIKNSVAVALISLTAIGCAKDHFLEQNPENDDQKRANSFFTATFAENQDGAAPLQQAMSKTTLNNDSNADCYNVQWEESDVVSVFDVDGTAYRYAPTALTNNNYMATLTPKDDSFIDIPTDLTNVTYYAAQPHSDDNAIDLGTKTITMTIPTVQTQKPGSLPMHYSVSESYGKTLQFYNVCGLLGFEITRDDIVCVAISANEDNETGQLYLTGKIKVDCSDITSPTWEIVDGVQDILVGTPGGDGIDKGWYYVAALPQTFTKGLTYTIVRKDGYILKRKIAKELVLGRSKWLFPSSAIDAVNENAPWEKIEYISDALELQCFLMVADKYTSEDKVYFDADIDMTGYNTIAPATTFAGTLSGLDPNNNTTNHCIKNWTTRHPLFKNIAAGATVGDFDIDKSCKIILNTVDYPETFGAVANECAGTISNITNNADAEFPVFKGHYVGLICGECHKKSGRIENCNNTGNLTYSGAASLGSTPLYLGMIAGRVNAEIDAESDATVDDGTATDGVIMMSECCNLGTVEIKLNNALTASLYVTGISGAFQNRGGVENCINGDETEGNDDAGKIYVSCPNAVNHLHVSGITFYAGAKVTGCKNYGDITCYVESAEGAADGMIRGVGVCGVAAYMGYSGHFVYNNHNYGDITFRGGYSGGYRACGQVYYYGLNVGGVFGAMRSCDAYYCTNSGNVSCKLGAIEHTTGSKETERTERAITKTFSGTTVTAGYTGGTDIGLSYNVMPAVGGVLASSWGTVAGCINSGSVKAEFLTSTGEKYAPDYGNHMATMVGGVAGGDYHAVWDPVSDATYNHWKYLSKRKISTYRPILSTDDASVQEYGIGTACENTGSVYASTNVTTGYCYCGGVVGYPNEGSQTALVSSTDANGNETTEYYVYTKLVDRCVNSGTVTFNGTGLVHLGGVSGGSGNHSECTNTGDVTIENAHTSSNVGGICGYILYNEVFKGGTASGNVECKIPLKTTDHVGNNYVGGVGGVIGGLSNTEFYLVGTTVDCTVKVPYVSGGTVGPWAVGQIIGVSDHNKYPAYNGQDEDANPGTKLVVGMSSGTIYVGAATDETKKQRHTDCSPVKITGGARVLNGASTSITTDNFGQYAFPWKGTTRTNGLYGPNISWYVQYDGSDGSSVNSYTATGSVPNA